LYQFQRDADGRMHFPYASAGAQEIYGFAPQALREDALQAFGRIHPDDVARVTVNVRRSAETLELWCDEYRVLLPGRGERWLNGLARPQRLGDGAVLWYGYLHDVTVAKQQALQLQETERL